MEDRTQVVIDIQLNEANVKERLAAVNSEMAELKESNRELRKAVQDGTKTWGEVSTQLADNEAKMKSLKAEQSKLSGQVSQMTQQNRTYGTSLKEQSAKLQDLRNRYQSLDETQRNSRGGQKMLKEIKELDKAMKEADAQQGIFGRNVGDYANKMAEAFDKAGVSVSGMKKKFDLLNTNPILFFLGVLVGWLVKLRDKMKETEGVTASLTKATTTLKPVMEGLGKVTEWLANIFSNVLDWAIDKTIQALGWLGRQLQKLGKMFGKDWGQGLIDTSFQMREVAHSTEQAAEAAEDAATATTNYASSIKELKREIEDFIPVLDDIITKTKKEAEANAKLAKSADEVLNSVGFFKEIYEGLDELDDLPLLDLVEVDDLSIEDKTTKFELFVESCKNSVIDFAKSYKSNAQAIEQTSASLQSSFGSLASMYEQMAKDESKSEEERAAAAKKAKAWSSIQIAANAGTAVAKGVATAVDVGFPAAIPAIAAMTAAILSAIAQAKQLAAQAYETGGVIGGYHGVSMGHDNTYVSARKGEMVLNGNQQRQLFELANGGTKSGGMYSALAEALANMPAPVLDYKEFTNFQNRVANLNELQKLK